MFCTKCNVSRDSGEFCSVCGTKLALNAPLQHEIPPVFAATPSKGKVLGNVPFLVDAIVAVFALISMLVFGGLFVGKVIESNAAADKAKTAAAAAKAKLQADSVLIADAVAACGMSAGDSGVEKVDDLHLSFSDLDYSDVKYTSVECLLKQIKAPDAILQDFQSIGYSDGMHLRTWDNITVSYSWNTNESDSLSGFLSISIDESPANPEGTIGS